MLSWRPRTQVWRQLRLSRVGSPQRGGRGGDEGVGRGVRVVEGLPAKVGGEGEGDGGYRAGASKQWQWHAQEEEVAQRVALRVQRCQSGSGWTPPVSEGGVKRRVSEELCEELTASRQEAAQRASVSKPSAMCVSAGCAARRVRFACVAGARGVGRGERGLAKVMDAESRPGITTQAQRHSPKTDHSGRHIITLNRSARAPDRGAVVTLFRRGT